jgi:hypothetical protein
MHLWASGRSRVHLALATENIGDVDETAARRRWCDVSKSFITGMETAAGQIANMKVESSILINYGWQMIELTCEELLLLNSVVCNCEYLLICPTNDAFGTARR